MGKIVRCRECGEVYRELEQLEDLRDNDSVCIKCNNTIEVADWDRVLASYEDEDEASDEDEEDWDEDEDDDEEEEEGDESSDSLDELDEEEEEEEEDDDDDEDDDDEDEDEDEDDVTSRDRLAVIAWPRSPSRDRRAAIACVERLAVRRPIRRPAPTAQDPRAVPVVRASGQPVPSSPARCVRLTAPPP
jgi:hypothetical protein